MFALNSFFYKIQNYLRKAKIIKSTIKPKAKILLASLELFHSVIKFNKILYIRLIRFFSFSIFGSIFLFLTLRLFVRFFYLGIVVLFQISIGLDKYLIEDTSLN